MLRWIPDWILYALALGVVLWAVFSEGSDNAPPPPPEAIQQEVQGYRPETDYTEGPWDHALGSSDTDGATGFQRASHDLLC